MNQPAEIIIEESSGDVYVFLDTVSDDHIVIKFSIDNKGFYKETTIPYGSFAWERAVRRAMRGLAFL